MKLFISEIQHAKIALCPCVSKFSGFSIPFDCLDNVSLYQMTCGISKTKVEMSLR